jgi:DNA-binding HxlR family transcriptional regulator
VRTRDYGQFCGLARAAEVLGQRWTILIVRDLLVGPRRYSDLLAGLPGIPTNVLASRLKELEEDDLVVREARTGSDRSVVYRATARAEELQAALDALGRWGAAGMQEPREGEVVADASLVGSLRVAGQGGTPPRRRPVTYEVTRSDRCVTPDELAAATTSLGFHEGRDQ